MRRKRNWLRIGTAENDTEFPLASESKLPADGPDGSSSALLLQHGRRGDTIFLFTQRRIVPIVLFTQGRRTYDAIVLFTQGRRTNDAIVLFTQGRSSRERDAMVSRTRPGRLLSREQSDGKE